MADAVLAHPASHPLVLLPVRIETRFAGTDLLVRVFPDQIHVDAHEPGLTDAERTAGRRYWEALWRCGREPAAERTAWDALCDALGPERASWVARSVEPANPGDRPDAPVPAPRRLRPPPRFTRAGRRANTYSRAAVARGLPERWTVVALGADRAVRAETTGDPVRTGLAVGLTPGFDVSALAPGDPPVDDHTRWMVDFEEACRAGMGVVLALAGSPLLDTGIDLLLVYGVCADPDPRASGRVLADLIEAHRASDGFGYVAPGTPTNQTSTAAPVPGRRSGPWREALRVTPAQPPPAAPGANARVLADALGLDVGDGARIGPTRPPGPPGRPTALGRGMDATLRSDDAARAMTTLLWPVTWGGYLWQQLDPVPTTAVDRGRRHAQEYLRAAGPLPALRFGDEPYGVLPVTPLDLWVPLEGPDLDPPGITGEVVDLLRTLRRDVWEPAVPGLPHLAGDGGDAQQTVLRILGMAPTTQRLFGRSVLGMDYFAHLWRFTDMALEESWRARLRDGADALRERLGLPGTDPQVGRSVLASTSFPIDAPVVRGPAGPGPEHYLATVASSTPDALAAATSTAPDGMTPLLYRLARHAVLTEYAMAVDRVLRRQAVPPPPGEHLDPQMIGLLTEPAAATLRERHARVVETPAGPMTVAAYLAEPRLDDPDCASLAEVRAALGTLAQLGDDVLDRLVRETLPLASHRLDAWITSLATRRLRWMRGRDADAASGMHLGGYAWVEGLAPAPPAEQVRPRPAGEKRTPVVRRPGNAGFVHAPSLAQATTAAVLRAAQQAFRDEGAAQADGGPLAVDLPSRRVRLAAGLLDGVRQGQPLGALLGYRFERAVQDHPVRTLAAWLDAFRELAPVRGIAVAADAGPTETVAATDVVDGLALHRLRRAGGVDLDTIGLRELDHPAERAAAVEVLALLDDAVDAVADLQLTEAVHQAVSGRALAAGAALDAASGGESPPQQLESVRTPRPGTAVTHRVLVTLGDPPAGPAPGWPVDADVAARAHAEPRVDAWLSTVLPAPGRVWLRVQVDGPDGTVAHRLLDLSGLRRCALDHVLMSEGGGDGVPSELEQHLAGLVCARPDVPAGATLTFDWTRDPRWGPEVVSVAEFREAVRAARALVTAARPVQPRDLVTPETQEVRAEPDPGLTDRAAAAIDALGTAAAALADPDRAREGLRRAGALGVPFSVPPPVPPDLDHDPEVRALHARQVEIVAAEVARRRALVAAEPATAAEPGRSGSLLRCVFGDGFPVVASFPPADVAALHPSPTDSDALQGGDRLASVTWAIRMARVRAGVERLVTVLSYAEALDTGNGLTLAVAQLPSGPGDRWIGLPTTAATPVGSRIGVVVHGAGSPGERVAGLVVDEWTEVVPAARTTTGVAYHADTPGASPPQAVLVAVPPDDRSHWDTGLVEATLREALDLARLRLVDTEALHPIDPDALTDVGQFLPAAYIAFNTAADVVSTDFTEGR